MNDGGVWKQERARLESFVRWPRATLLPLRLSKAGFFYTSVFDRVCCGFCGIVLGDWELRDDPMVEHAAYSPACSFVKNYYSTAGITPVRRYPAYGIKIRNGNSKKNLNFGICEKIEPMHSKFADAAARLDTFQKWPIALKTRPEALCEAGLFYKGSGDHTACFQCGLELCDWKDNDDPWAEHATYSPKCTYVLSVKGIQYVKCVQSASATPPETMEEVSSQPSTTVTAESDKSETEACCKVCYLQDVNVVFLPCAHLIACVTCATKLDSCPVCRSKIQATLRVFAVR